MGISEQQLQDLLDFESSNAFNDLEKDVVRLSRAMSGSPANVPAELVQRLQIRLKERGVVELVSAIAWENYRSRFNRGLGATAAGFTEGTVCLLPHVQV